MAGNRKANRVCADDSAVGLNSADRPGFVPEQPPDRSVLVNLDAERIGGAGISPGHRIMPVHRRIGVNHAGKYRQPAVLSAAGQRPESSS